VFPPGRYRAQVKRRETRAGRKIKKAMADMLSEGVISQLQEWLMQVERYRFFIGERRGKNDF
jgi:hypothetical protein